MSKQYKITYKATPDASKSLTPASLNMTFVPGKSKVTSSAAAARYALRRPTQFAVELVGADAKAKDEPVAPPPEPEPEEMPEVAPIEAWFDLIAKSKNGVPKNDEIKKFASDHDIDLGSASVKGDMIEAIEDALDVE